MALDERDRPNSFRLVMLGEQGVGKSSIALRLVKDQFREYNEPTVGAAYLNQTFKIEETTVKLDLWDTAGQERFASLAPMYYRTAQAAIVTYDISSRSSFNRGIEWVRELRVQAPITTVIMFCGNKIDAPEARQVSSQEGYDVATDKGLMFSEVSAKTGQGVKNMFYKIAEALVNNKRGDGVDGLTRDRNIQLRRPQQDGKGCPC